MSNNPAEPKRWRPRRQLDAPSPEAPPPPPDRGDLDPFVYKRAPDLFAGNTAKLPPAPPIEVRRAAAEADAEAAIGPGAAAGVGDAWSDIAPAEPDDSELTSDGALQMGSDEVEVEVADSDDILTAGIGSTQGEHSENDGAADGAADGYRDADPVESADTPENDSEIYASGVQSAFKVPLVSDVDIVASPPTAMPSLSSPVDAAAESDFVELVESDAMPRTYGAAPSGEHVEAEDAHAVAADDAPPACAPNVAPIDAADIPLAPEEPVIKAGTLVDGINPFPHSLLLNPGAFPHSLLHRDAASTPPAASAPPPVAPPPRVQAAPPPHGRAPGTRPGTASGRRRSRGPSNRAPTKTHRGSESGISPSPAAAAGGSAGTKSRVGSASGIGSASAVGSASGVGSAPRVGAGSGPGHAAVGRASGVGKAQALVKAPSARTTAAGSGATAGAASGIGSASGINKPTKSVHVQVSSRRNRATGRETSTSATRGYEPETARRHGGLGLLIGACAVLGVVAIVLVVVVGMKNTGGDPVAQPENDVQINDTIAGTTPTEINRDIEPPKLDPDRVWHNKLDQAEARYEAAGDLALIPRERELATLADECEALRAEANAVRADEPGRKRLNNLTDVVIEAHGQMIIERIRERGDDLADLEDVAGLRRLIERVRAGDAVLFGSETIATDDRYAWLQADLSPMLGEWEALLNEVDGLAGPSLLFRNAWRRLRRELSDSQLRDARLDAIKMREVVNQLADLVRTYEGATRYPSDFIAIWDSLRFDAGDAVAEDGLTYGRIFPARSADLVAWLDLAQWYIETYTSAAPTDGRADVMRVLRARVAGVYIAVGSELVRGAVGELANNPPTNLVDDFNQTMRLFWQADQIRRLDQVAREFQAGFEASYQLLGDRLYRVIELMQSNRQIDDVTLTAVTEMYLFALRDDDHPLHDAARRNQVQRWHDARTAASVDVVLRVMDYVNLQERDVEDNTATSSAPAWAWEFGAAVLTTALGMLQDFPADADRLRPRLERFGSRLITAALTDAASPFVERPQIAQLIAARLDVVTENFVRSDHVQADLRTQLLAARESLEGKIRGQ